MTPQKVFMEHIHFWILPLILVVAKLFYDLLPTPVFFGSILLAILGYYSYERIKANQSERTAKQLEDTADTFLDELNTADNLKKEKEAKKKNMKEQQRQERLRAQQLKKKAKDSSKGESGKIAATENDDEDDDAMLIRMAKNQKGSSRN